MTRDFCDISFFLNRLQNSFSLLVSLLSLSCNRRRCKSFNNQQPHLCYDYRLWSVLQSLESGPASRVVHYSAAGDRQLFFTHVALSSPLPFPLSLRPTTFVSSAAPLLISWSAGTGRTFPSSGWVEEKIILWIKEEGASLSSSSSVCLSIHSIRRHILLQKDLVPCLCLLLCSFEESIWWHEDKRTKPETGTDHLPFHWRILCFELLSSLSRTEQRLESQRWLHGSIWIGTWYVSVLWNEWICEKQMGQFANPKNGFLFPFNSAQSVPSPFLSLIIIHSLVELME